MDSGVGQIINAIAADSSRLAKEEILRTNSGNELLKKTFLYAYNPYLNFYIKGSSIGDCPLEDLIELNLADVFQVLDRLVRREATGNIARELITRTFWSLPSEDGDLFRAILNRDLRCGATESTANKIWKDLIPEYEVMLASKDEEKSRKHIKFPAFGQIKYDGMRSNVWAAHNADTVNYISRNGKEIHLSADEELNKAFKDLAFLMGWGNDVTAVFDGELVVVNADGSVANRQTGNGIGNKAIRGTISDDDLKKVGFRLWDVVDGEKFHAGYSALVYKIRYQQLKEAVVSLNNPRIQIAKQYELNSWDDAAAVYDEAYSSGEEGIIVKNQDMPWENKRSKHQMKMKALLDATVTIVGWEEGTGKNKDKIGAYIVASAYNQVVGNVGIGFSDEDRGRDGDQDIGKLVDIQYNSIVKDKKTGKPSFFLPRLMKMDGEIKWRDDKNVADVL